MSYKHILSLEVPETANEALLRIVDTTSYDSNLPVECPILQIMSPGFNVPVNIDMLPGFNVALNACTLGIQSANCGTTTQPLPDGVYVIRYSVSPNDKAWVEYNHLRVTSTMTAYYKKLAEIDCAPCEPSAETKKILAEMCYIRAMIDAAKAKVEYCQSPREGVELLTYAIKKLKSLECSKVC